MKMYVRTMPISVGLFSTFGPVRNISETSGCVAMKVCTDGD